MPHPNLEFLKLKVFLYKYNPPFHQVTSATTELAKIDKYTVPFDEKYFTKYDITDFVSSYTFNQDLTQNTFSWSITLQESVLSFEEINQRLRVEGLRILDILTNISQAEAQARNMTDANIIENAKLARGHTQDSLVSKAAAGTLPIKRGLRLSDLVQAYDFISCYVYKSTTPLENIKGQISVDSLTKLATFTQTASGRSLTSIDLQKESILATIPGFSNEFNGFLLTKNVNRNPGAVDTLTITGNGLTRLFGATRRILKGDILQKSLFDLGEIVDPKAFTPFENIYANKTVQQILTDLFGIVYRITLNSIDNFYDIALLKVSNSRQTNLFVIPPFLLALVMKRRGFKFRDTTNLTGLLADVKPGEVPVQAVNKSSNATIHAGKDPVFISDEIDQLRAYFLFIQDVFRFFNAQLNTPFEIIDEIKSKTFLEFFERSNGEVIVRPPQYNDTLTTLFSSDLDNINTQYSETVENLVSRQKIGYAVDILETIAPIQAYFYTNGKLLAQYGWLEASADINPNVKNDKPKNINLDSKRQSGLFKYAEYFLRIYNASLKTGTITADYDPTIEIGKTFFDEKNNKFGYIGAVSKTVNVGGTAAITFELRYVRDAVLDNPSIKDASTLQFENLLRLVDISRSFGSGNSAVVDPGLGVVV